MDWDFSVLRPIQLWHTWTRTSRHPHPWGLDISHPWELDIAIQAMAETVIFSEQVQSSQDLILFSVKTEISTVQTSKTESCQTGFWLSSRNHYTSTYTSHLRQWYMPFSISPEMGIHNIRQMVSLHRGQGYTIEFLHYPLLLLCVPLIPNFLQTRSKPSFGKMPSNEFWCLQRTWDFIPATSRSPRKTGRSNW